MGAIPVRSWAIVHLIFHKGTLKVLDSNSERMAPSAIVDGIPNGHYKLPFVERLAPHQRAYGPGRIFIADLTRRDANALIKDEKAEATLDDDRIRFEHRLASIGKLGAVTASIHGGGESLSPTMSRANFQPLTQPKCGIRLHNSELAKLMNILEPRLRCQQIIILTVC
jgi:hypothetical protein